MAEQIDVAKEMSETEIYEQMCSSLKHILKIDEPIISNLSIFTALFKQSFAKISWIGFYILKNDCLWLGPFQGKLACTRIETGKGVCGTAVQQRDTIIVENVEEFPGHIACDSDSKSEIAIPVFQGENIWGVLDIDSHQKNAFNNTDKEYLEKICKFLSVRLDLSENLI